MKKQATCTTPQSPRLKRVQVEIHLTQATAELRAAWLLCKQTGMSGRALDIADMVISLETAVKEVNEENTGSDDFC